jgi:hypothetical protein
VAKRIGISGVNDDLCKFMPLHENLLDPLELDEHSALLLAEYQKQKSFLNGNLHCYFGRSRLATLANNKNGRQQCSYLGRCLWGCPTHSLYTPSITLSECKRFTNFRYVPNVYVSHFSFDSKCHITTVATKSINNGTSHEFPVAKLVLAAGTLSSSKIFLDSIYRKSGEIVKLHGLMDNRQILIPFINFNLLGKAYDPNSYQYHQLSIGIEREKSKEYIHGLITTLKTALIHPIVQKLPFDLRTSQYIFRNMHAALGLLNLNFHDERRKDNFITLDTKGSSLSPTLLINYLPMDYEKDSIKGAVRKAKRALWKLKCIVPPGMSRVRPMGSSVHYAGTLPMSRKKLSLTTSEYCQSHDFENLYIVDGSTFPFLPAKNITFTLMANAMRIADKAF